MTRSQRHTETGINTRHMQSDSQSEKRIGKLDSSTDFQVSPNEFTTLRYDVLAVLAEESRKGTAVKPVIDGIYQKDKSLPQIYNALNWLADRGLVDIGKLDARTNLYEITDDGRSVIEQRITSLRHTAGEGETDANSQEGSA